MVFRAAGSPVPNTLVARSKVGRWPPIRSASQSASGRPENFDDLRPADWPVIAACPMGLGTPSFLFRPPKIRERTTPQRGQSRHFAGR